jgi:hypothetical protein
MNINKISELCDRFVILIDKSNNSLIGNVQEIDNPKFFISVPTHTFYFKLVKNGKNTYQIQCLNTFKILIVKPDGSVFFEEYFVLKDLESSLFYCVYDDISLSLFPSSRPDSILYFNERLSLKKLDIEFNEDDQTIFEYEQIDYSNLVVLSNMSNIYDGIKIVENKSIKDFFYNILNLYHNVPDHLIVCFGKPLFPLDYYIEKEHWGFIDRYFNMANLETYKRIVDLSNINSIEMITSNNQEWLEIDSIMNNIPKLSSTQMIWLKIINADINNNVYFSSISTFILKGSLIKKRQFKYYNDIYLLLERSNDIKIHNLIIYALYTIFFE